MRTWDYHVPVADLGALAGMLREAGLGFWIAAAAALFLRRRSWEPWLALALVAIFWLVVPYQHSRFLFPVHGVIAVAIGAAASPRGDAPGDAPSDAPRRAWQALLLASATLGSVLELPAPGRMAVPAAAVAGVALLAPARRYPVRWAALSAVLLLAVLLGLGLASHRQRYPGWTLGHGDADADQLESAWRWLYSNVQGAHVAYTGSNLTFPLGGRNLSNRVTYVNVAGGPADRAHDFPQSGASGSAEPAVYRPGGTFETWRQNLRAQGCDILFVSTLYPIVAREIPADDEGFPIERAWADGHPDDFRLLYRNSDVRIYGVTRP
jgi:hypothetical protein